jgi:hypothetical protein
VSFWRPRILAAVAIALTLGTSQAAPAQAQTPNNCLGLIYQTVAPILNQANRYTPGGAFPYGHAPLAQPFGTNPQEYAIWGYPGQAYYGSYTARPGAAPFGPGMGAAPVPELPPEQLTPTAIMQHLIDSGTWDRLSPTDQADWLMRLAGLQRDQFSQYLGLANLQRESQRDLANIRRIPYDLSERYQERAQQWRASYGFTADAVRNLLTATCNPATGQIGGGSGVAGLPGLGGLAGGLGGVPTSTAGLCLVGVLTSPGLCPFGR